MKSPQLVIIVGALYLLHQDFWFWRTAHPLLFGFVPIGLFYHACYTVVTSFALWLMVKRAWPTHLEEEIEHADEAQNAGLQSEAQEDQAS